MMSKQIFFIILLIISTNSFKLKIKKHPGFFRNLAMQSKEEICKKGYKNYTAPNYSKVDDYTKANKMDENSGTKLIKGIMFEGSVTDIQSVVSDVIPYIIFLVCAILVILTWPLFILCFCCGCCCFDKNVKSGICGLVFYIIAMSFMLGVIIAGIVGFVKGTKFVQSIDGTACSLLTFFDHFINGDDSHSDYQWIGATHLNVAFEELKKPILNIQGNSSSFQEVNKSELETKTTAYSQALEQTLTDGKKMSIRYGDKDITIPKLSNEYSPQNPQGIYVTATVENQVVIQQPAKALPIIVESAKDIQNLNVNELTSQFDTLIGEVNDMASTIEGSADSMVGNYLSMKDTAESMMLLAFKILYGIFIGIAVILMTILTLYALVNCFLFKIPLHVMWNIVLVICILNFILGCILGIFGYITSIIAPTIAYFVSPDFISDPSCPFKSSPQIGNCINACLNGDGNLYKAFDVQNKLKASGSIDNLLKNGKTITSLTDDMTKLSKSKAYEDFEKRLDSYNADLVSLTEGVTDGDINVLLSDLNQGGSAKYVLDKANCGGLAFDETGCNGDNNKCYLITNKNCESSSNTKVSNLAKYIKSIKEEIAKQKKYYSQSLDEKYKGATGEIQEPIKKCGKLMKELMDTVNGYLSGDASLINMFNCGFIGKDLIVFMDQLYFRFSGSCKGMAIACGVGSFLSYFGVIMVLRAIYRNGPKARENSKKDKKQETKDEETIHFKPQKV